MKPSSNNEKNGDLHQLIEAWFVGGLSDAQRAELEERLLENKDLRGDFLQAAAMDSALRNAALERSLESLPEPEPAPVVARPSRRSLLALAACLLLLLAGGLALYPLLREPVVASLVQVTGTVSIHGDSGSRPAQQGSRIRNGSELVCASGDTEVVIRLVDGSIFTAKSGSRVRLLREKGQFQLEVSAGVLEGDVMKQPVGKPLLISTADSTLKVLGTRLTLRCGEDSTRLIVEEGRVEMTRRSDDEKVLVETDETAMVAQGGELGVMNMSGLSSKQIEIVSARYGAGDAWVDVTQPLRSRVTNSRLIPVGDFNHLVGDPITNVVKSLEVEFLIDGVPGTRSYDEYVHAARRMKTTEIILSHSGNLEFTGAQWIWHEGAGQAPGTWYFRKDFEWPAARVLRQARILLTCDNTWKLQVNGQPAGGPLHGDRNGQRPYAWQLPGLIDITGLLMPGRNVITVEGTNRYPENSPLAGSPSPAGLLVKLLLEFKNGAQEWTSDDSWISAADPEEGWQEPGFVAGPTWRPVSVLGDHGMPPWGVLDASFR